MEPAVKGELKICLHDVENKILLLQNQESFASLFWNRALWIEELPDFLLIATNQRVVAAKSWLLYGSILFYSKIAILRLIFLCNRKL